MACGKKSANAPTEEFILESPAPVDVSAKLSAIYRELSLKVNSRIKTSNDNIARNGRAFTIIYKEYFLYLNKNALSKGRTFKLEFFKKSQLCL